MYSMEAGVFNRVQSPRCMGDSRVSVTLSLGGAYTVRRGRSKQVGDLAQDEGQVFIYLGCEW